MNSLRNCNRLFPLRPILGSGIALLLSLHAAAQSGPTPTYIQNLTPYTVRAMSGGLAPSNGTTTLRSVTPSEWLNNDPAGGVAGVIIAWSGGAKGIGSKLFVNGGGHTDSANNGLYTFDFSGTDRPTGWLPTVISPVSAVRSGGTTYSDGKPVAVHTYDGAVYANHNDHIYRFGGSRYVDGFMSNGSFKFNVATRTWSSVPNYPAQAGGAKTLYDAASGKIFVTMNDTFDGFFYRTANDTWSGVKSYGGDGFPFDSGGAWDPTRNRGIIVGSGERSLISLNFANETVSVTSFSVSGPTAIFSTAGPSAIYDPGADVYWLFAGSASSSGWTTLYEMNADGPPWVVTPHTLSGDTISRESGLIGSWGRWVLMDQWRAIGTVASTNSPAYVIKLPAGTTVRPNPPASVTAN